MNIDRATAQKFFLPLESLRGLAALLVVIYHAQWTNPLGSLRFFENAALMVDFFFVLSGFVICHSYGGKLRRRADVGRFLWLRLGRLYPLHFALLLVFLCFEFAKFLVERNLGLTPATPAFAVNDSRSFVTNLLLIHSLHVHDHLTYNFPSWSISTEFYTYALFAAVGLACGDRAKLTWAALLLVVLSTTILLRLDIVPLSYATYDWGYLRSVGGFFLGVLTYQAYARIRSGRTRMAAAGENPWAGPLALLAVVAWLSTVNPDSRWTYLLPVLSAILILSLVLAPHNGLPRLLSTGPLVTLGRISYSLYMVHAAVVWVVNRVLVVVFGIPTVGERVATQPLAGLLILLGYVATVIALSRLTYRWIEQPFRERSRQFAAGKASQLR